VIGRKRTSRGDRVRGFDMTPMIDVVFQLIIFFLFTSQFGQITRTEVDLPKEAGIDQPAKERPTFVIDITAEGDLRLEGDPITFTRLEGAVAREVERVGGDGEQIKVLIRPDRGARAGHLNRLAESLARLGVRRWSIGTADEQRDGSAG